MNFNRKSLVLVALLAAGCGGGGGYGGGNDNPAPAPPTGANGTAFVSFIKAQLAQTSDTAEPTEVNDLQFQFDESETSFDDVLQ
ncbi:hypothetical protein [Steroidobacter agaridevorans]|uniref:hypothetical protein n=1 Tax=Steroidobacter agaridevorans TaxID=2695856 RepID=UPI00132AD922|nr:hypothetical protein [Steroidobacter agaridevorans]GFE90001.1 hypothetical protein GCM10011488_49550 [Steroidobacter agaridevorans]